MVIYLLCNHEKQRIFFSLKHIYSNSFNIQKYLLFACYIQDRLGAGSGFMLMKKTELSLGQWDNEGNAYEERSLQY